MSRLASILLVLSLVAVLAASCGNDDPASPGGAGAPYLAGGGRQASDDAFSGGAEGSGPGWPDYELPSPYLRPLYFAGIDCRENAGTSVITDAEAWQAWWTDAIACTTETIACDWDGSEPGGGSGVDSTIVEPPQR